MAFVAFGQDLVDSHPDRAEPHCREEGDDELVLVAERRRDTVARVDPRTVEPRRRRGHRLGPFPEVIAAPPIYPGLRGGTYGRAPCRVRECKHVYHSVVTGNLDTTNNKHIL